MFRVITFILIVFIALFWVFMKEKSDKGKKRVRTVNLLFHFFRSLPTYLGPIIVLQLFGVSIAPIYASFPLEAIGFVTFVIGIALSVISRLQLGINWTSGSEYQVKRNHSLVTSGIYSYIRHPIYTAMALIVTGAELVVKSYLFVIFLVISMIWIYIQAKKEEKILTEHFGKQYLEYKKRTKMFIPRIF